MRKTKPFINRKIIHYFIIPSAIIVAVIIISSFLKNQPQPQPKPQTVSSNKKIIKLAPRSELTPTLTPAPIVLVNKKEDWERINANLSILKKDLIQIINGENKFDHSHNNGIKYYKNEILYDIPTIDLWVTSMVEVYPFNPQVTTQFDIAYEGITTTRDLTREVKLLESITGKVSINNLWASVNYEPAQAFLSEKNGYKFIEYYTYFKPGGNWLKQYLIYIPKNKLIISAYFTYQVYRYPISPESTTTYKQSEKDHVFLDVSFPSFIMPYVTAFESTLFSI